MDTKPNKIELRVTNIYKRFCALLIDASAYYFCLTPIAYLAAISLGQNKPYETQSLILIFFLVFVAALFLAKDVFCGISIGKLILGIMVRDKEHPRKIPSKERLIVRNLPLFFLLFEIIVLFFGDKNTRIGDKMCNTIVVNNPDKFQLHFRVTMLVAIIIITLLILLAFASILIQKYSLH